jgi:hypothetical protein
LAASLTVLDLEAVARRASDPRMQEVLTIMGSAAPDMTNFRNVARDERPFLPDLAWAFFNAYTTIL